MTELQKKLFALRDAEYAAFQAGLTPTVSPELFIGVRTPILRKFAKEFAKEPAGKQFLTKLPHTYYEENMLHGFLIEQIKDFDECVRAIDAFLPYVDNWAVCDCMSPKILGKHKDRLMIKIKEWSASPETYTCRFGIEMLMSWFLNEDFKPEYPKIASCIRSEEYYIKMMVAWYFATALAKQWDAVIPYFTRQEMDVWTHNKAIQKARESYRITPEQKEYLKTLRRKA